MEKNPIWPENLYKRHLLPKILVESYTLCPLFAQQSSFSWICDYEYRLLLHNTFLRWCQNQFGVIYSFIVYAFNILLDPGALDTALQGAVFC